MLNDDGYNDLVELFAQRSERDALTLAAKIILLLAEKAGAENLAEVSAKAAASTPRPAKNPLPGARHYGYFRSSADYRLRIALNLKRAALGKRSFVGLRKGMQHKNAYRKINPAALVPVLVSARGVLNQSLAIIEMLNELLPAPDLLPGDAWQRAQIRALAMDVACDTAPVANLRVLVKLREDFSADDKKTADWRAYWMRRGFDAVEKRMEQLRGENEFIFGPAPTMAEICLVPQAYNAARFNVDMRAYPNINDVVRACLRRRAFADAAPEKQPDCDI